MNVTHSAFGLSIVLSITYAPAPRSVGCVFQFGYNILVLAAITEPTETEEHA
jgi:hypothetical protein